MNDIGVIHLSGFRGGFAVVDADVFEELSQHKWYSSRRGYITSVSVDPVTQKRTMKYLHRVVNRTAKGVLTDHRNGFKLDNTRRNLRDATKSQNMMNSKVSRAVKASQFKGVLFFKKNGKWVARIKLNGKQKWLGTFDSETAAAQCYNEFAKIMFGEFAKPNDLGVGISSLRGTLCSSPSF